MEQIKPGSPKIFKISASVIAIAAVFVFAIYISLLMVRDSSSTLIGKGDNEMAVSEEAPALPEGQPPILKDAVPGEGYFPSAPVGSKTANVKYGQKLIRRASLVVSVERGKAKTSLDKAINITEKLGGYVLNSTMIQGEEGEIIANASVRIPEAKLKNVLEEFTKLGRMISRDISAEDVTTQVVDLEARQRHLKTTEAALLKLMDKAAAVKDILSVQKELLIVQNELEQIKSQLDVLKEQVTYATVNVEFKEPSKITSPTDWGVSGAIGRAIRNFMNTTTGLIEVLGGALPVLILLGMPIIGVLLWVRKNRKI